MNFDDSNEIKITLPFYRSSSTFWNIFGGLATKVFYSLYEHGANLLKITCDVKSKVICSHKRYVNNISNYTQIT